MRALLLALLLLPAAGAVRADEEAPRRRPGVTNQEANPSWLAGQQHEDGSWRHEGTEAGDAVRVTGLVLWAYLSHSYTHRGRHPFATVVRDGLKFLKRRQREDGRFASEGTEGTLTEHGPAALAMIEGYGMTGSPILRGSAERAWAAIARAARDDDPAFEKAEAAGPALLCAMSVELLRQDRRSRRGGNAADAASEVEPFAAAPTNLLGLERWKDREAGESLRREAVVTLARVLYDHDEGVEARFDAHAQRMAASGPSWKEGEGSHDPYGWWFATVAFRQIGRGERETAWKTWRAATADIRRHRQTEPAAWRGSWEPDALPGYRGSRVELTALCALATPLTCTSYLVRVREP